MRLPTFYELFLIPNWGNILKGSQLTIPIEETYTVAKAIVDGLKKRNIAASVVEV